MEVSREMAAELCCPLSASRLKLIDESLLKFYGRYITGEIPRDPASPKMSIGLVAHTLVFEPDKALDYVVRPFKAKRAKFAQDHLNKIVVDKQEYWNRGAEAAAAVRRDEDALKYLTRLEAVEQEVTWFDEELGRPCLGRLDGVSPGLIVDLKVTTDPERPFERNAHYFRYPGQLSFYWKAAQHLYPDYDGPWEAIIIAVRNDEPFDVVVWDLTHLLEVGWVWCKRQNEKLSRAIETMVWENELHRGVHPLNVPESYYLGDDVVSVFEDETPQYEEMTPW